MEVLQPNGTVRARHSVGTEEHGRRGSKQIPLATYVEMSDAGLDTKMPQIDANLSEEERARLVRLSHKVSMLSRLSLIRPSGQRPGAQARSQVDPMGKPTAPHACSVCMLIILKS